jgi:hypothetical protein
MLQKDNRKAEESVNCSSTRMQQRRACPRYVKKCWQKEERPAAALRCRNGGVDA